MMLGPSGYISDFKDASFEKIIKERKRLIKEIKELEKIVFDKDKKDEAWFINPGPDVRYQVVLEYLSEICLLLSDKYNSEYEWGDLDD